MKSWKHDWDGDQSNLIQKSSILFNAKSQHNVLDGKVQHKCYSEQQILKTSAQLDEFFSKYIFSKPKITGFEKPSFQLT